MTNKVYKKKGYAPSHPGKILKSGFIDQYDLSISTVSHLLGITREHLSRIVNGHTPITPDIALKLEILIKTPASQWLAMQANYDTYVMEQNSEFQKYKQTLESWLENSLNLLPRVRRADKKTLALVAKAAMLAKNLSRKENIA